MLYNAHTICVVLGVNMQRSPKGDPMRGGKGSGAAVILILTTSLETHAANGVLGAYTVAG